MDSHNSEAVPLKVWIEEIRLASGSTIRPTKTGVTVVVGANNSGKTTLLNDISLGVSMLSGQNSWGQGGRLIAPNGLTPAVEGDQAALGAWLEEHAALSVGQFPIQARPQWQRLGRTLPQHAIDNWGATWAGLDFWLHYFSAGAMPGFESARAVLGSAPVDPLQVLYESPDLMRRLSKISMEVFRVPLTLDDESPNFRLCVGTPNVTRPTPDEARQRYRGALAELPTLNDQGHGIRSWMSIVLQLIAGSFPIVLADEPEAYLHPPQARALGRHLAELTDERGAQVIVATHDRDLLAGLLETGTQLSVVRLSGIPPNTRAHQLPADAVRDLWSDPVLRYSDILDGLFYSAVIITEGHRDCTFYQAATEYFEANSTSFVGDSPRAGDVMFAAANGKDNMAKLHRALAAVRVPVVFSPDLDALNPRSSTLKSLVEALGADWASFEAPLKTALNPITQARPRTVSQVMNELAPAIKAAEDIGNQDWNTHTAASIRDIVKLTKSPSEALKKHGVRCVSGSNRRQLNDLLDSLDQLGLVAARVGELERFAEECTQDKAVWLEEALAARAYTRPEAQDHVKRLLAAVRARTGAAMATE